MEPQRQHYAIIRMLVSTVILAISPNALTRSVDPDVAVIDTTDASRFETLFIESGGWPAEAGYWIGRQIVTAYVEQSTDKGIAIRELPDLQDPLAVLDASGFADRLSIKTNAKEDAQ